MGAVARSGSTVSVIRPAGVDGLPVCLMGTTVRRRRLDRSASSMDGKRSGMVESPADGGLWPFHPGVLLVFMVFSRGGVDWVECGCYRGDWFKGPDH